VDKAPSAVTEVMGWAGSHEIAAGGGTGARRPLILALDALDHPSLGVRVAASLAANVSLRAGAGLAVQVGIAGVLEAMHRRRVATEGGAGEDGEGDKATTPSRRRPSSRRAQSATDLLATLSDHEVAQRLLDPTAPLAAALLLSSPADLLYNPTTGLLSTRHNVWLHPLRPWSDEPALWLVLATNTEAAPGTHELLLVPGDAVGLRHDAHGNVSLADVTATRSLNRGHQGRLRVVLGALNVARRVCMARVALQLARRALVRATRALVRSRAISDAMIHVPMARLLPHLARCLCLWTQVRALTRQLDRRSSAIAAGGASSALAAAVRTEAASASLLYTALVSHTQEALTEAQATLAEWAPHAYTAAKEVDALVDEHALLVRTLPGHTADALAATRALLALHGIISSSWSSWFASLWLRVRVFLTSCAVSILAMVTTGDSSLLQRLVLTAQLDLALWQACGVVTGSDVASLAGVGTTSQVVQAVEQGMSPREDDERADEGGAEAARVRRRRASTPARPVAQMPEVRSVVRSHVAAVSDSVTFAAVELVPLLAAELDAHTATVEVALQLPDSLASTVQEVAALATTRTLGEHALHAAASGMMPTRLASSLRAAQLSLGASLTTREAAERWLAWLDHGDGEPGLMFL
jgi:hypothetical protein